MPVQLQRYEDKEILTKKMGVNPAYKNHENPSLESKLDCTCIVESSDSGDAGVTTYFVSTTYFVLPDLFCINF